MYLAVVDNGRRQDLPPADNGLVGVKDRYGASWLCQLKVCLIEIPQPGQLLRTAHNLHCSLDHVQEPGEDLWRHEILGLLFKTVGAVKPRTRQYPSKW